MRARSLMLIIALLLLFSCVRQPSTVRQAQPTESSLETTPKALTQEMTVNPDSKLDRKSVALLTEGGETISIGAIVSDELIDKSNAVVTSDELGVPFGPITGFANSDTLIGWNNQRRIIYVELFSRRVATFDGIRIGATREEIVRILGAPYIEKASGIRYQNTETENVGILFVFNAFQIVVRIVLFAYA